MDGEADVVIKKATDVIFTKNDAEDAQVFPKEKTLGEDVIQISTSVDELSLTRSTSSYSTGSLSKQSKNEHGSPCGCRKSSTSLPVCSSKYSSFHPSYFASFRIRLQSLSSFKRLLTRISPQPHLDPGRKGPSPRFTTSFIRRCSNPECPARRGPSRGSLVFSAKKFKQIIAISLKAKSFHSLIHIEYEGVTQEDTEAVILTMTSDTTRLRRLLESGHINVRERNTDNWTLLHVSDKKTKSPNIG